MRLNFGEFGEVLDTVTKKGVVSLIYLQPLKEIRKPHPGFLLLESTSCGWKQEKETGAVFTESQGMNLLMLSHLWTFPEHGQPLCT